MKSMDLEKQNKLLLQKTNEILMEWKNDYVKLIDVLKEKEKTLESCQAEIEHKKNKIYTLEDRLISISILEKKIKTLHELNERDTAKLINNYELKIKEVSDPYRVSPNLVKFQIEKESEIYQKDRKTYETQKELIKAINIQKQKEKELQIKFKKMKLDSDMKSAEILKLKEKLSEQNKDSYHINQTKNLFIFF